MERREQGAEKGCREREDREKGKERKRRERIT